MADNQFEKMAEVQREKSQMKHMHRSLHVVNHNHLTLSYYFTFSLDSYNIPLRWAAQKQLVSI